VPAVLLGANMLIALVVEDRIHHPHAQEWLGAAASGFATHPTPTSLTWSQGS
jgi:hypothetical protein